MKHDPNVCLADIKITAEKILEFTRNKSLNDYLDDPMLQFAVERGLQIIGEAMVRLRETAPDMLATLSHTKEAIGLRNIITHGYDILDPERIWNTVQTDIPTLIAEVEHLLPPPGFAL